MLGHFRLTTSIKSAGTRLHTCLERVSCSRTWHDDAIQGAALLNLEPFTLPITPYPFMEVWRSHDKCAQHAHVLLVTSCHRNWRSMKAQLNEPLELAICRLFLLWLLAVPYFSVRMEMSTMSYLNWLLHAWMHTFVTSRLSTVPYFSVRS